jgi:signal transduction histidine kinase
VLNLAAVEILPEVHLLLGPLAVMVAAVLYGPAAGGVAGAVSGMRTLWLWGHPWGWLNFTVEGLLVGALSRRVMPITASGLYWLLSPLYFLLTYRLLLHLPGETVVVSGVKQAVNGLLAALVIQVVLLVPQVRRRLSGLLPPPLAHMPIGRAFGSALTLGAVIPVLLVGGAEGRARFQVEVQRLDAQNLHVAQVVARELEGRVSHATHAAAQLASRLTHELGPEGALPPRSALESSLEQLVTYSPEVFDAYVGTPGGVAWAFWPRTDPEGNPLAGMDFSDREYVRAAREASGPFVSDVFLGRGGVDWPLVVAVAPIRREAHYAGFVQVSLDLRRLREQALMFLRSTDQRVLVLDTRDGVVVDSMDGDTQRVESVAGTPLTEALARVGGGSGTGTYEAHADDPRALVRARSQRHFGVEHVDRLGWRVVTEQPVSQLQRKVEQSYAGLLLTLLAAVVTAGLMALVLSRAIISPVQGVSDAALRLAAGERTARAPEAMEVAPLELRQLAQSFDRMAQQLSNQLEAIERGSREKDAFLSIAAHELRTPLTALKAQVHLLRRKLDAEHAERIDLFDRQLDRLTRLVNQLLDASQLGSDKLPLQRARLDLGEVTKRVAEMLVHASPLHTLQLDVAPVVGAFDEMRVEQVLHNLISNAIKYSPTGGPIDVRLRVTPEGEAELEVGDRGIGLGTEDREQLFERFERGERQELSGISGLGVGLYVSREIVWRHGGRIALRPRAGGGTMATVRLPLSG